MLYWFFYLHIFLLRKEINHLIGQTYSNLFNLFFYLFLKDGFAFCHYPFVFEVKEKAILMEYDAEIQMKVLYYLITL